LPPPASPHLWKKVAATCPLTRALGSIQTFVIRSGWQQAGVTLMIRHIANGSTHELDYDESMLLLGVGF